MSTALEIDVKEPILNDGAFGSAEVQQLIAALSQDTTRMRPLREAVQQLEQRGDLTGSHRARLGVAYYLLGRYGLAADRLSTADNSPIARFYLAKAYHALEQYKQAVDAFTAAAQAGYHADQCALGRAESLRYSGDARAALVELDKLSGAIEQTADYLYQRGATVAAIGGNPSEVVALYERAVEVDGNHPGALFGLAIESDRRGDDDEALRRYERAVARPPVHVGSLLNLGLMYEDRNHYERARQCYLRILDSYPNEKRARLFLKDAQASGEMFFDEDAQRKRDRLSQILNIPVTDFELSVRSRNCLQKMGITTLGDLAMTSEQELLASKNFGETSLVEIRELLGAKGLELGQFAHERSRTDFVGIEQQTISADEQALLNKPIADLNLSVRARKCMIRLQIATIGELVRHTGDELLECKNFGVTSLNEVREKLVVHGIKLRGD